MPHLIRHPKHRSRRRRWLTWAAAGFGVLFAAILLAGIWVAVPLRNRWIDRRPIGVLFLASNFHSSAVNPRGWFNDPTLDVVGTNGPENFKKALFDYTDRSIGVLRRINAQGVIVWDVEGQQFPHKTSYIGDPRLVGRLAPEMDLVADELFARLRNAGFRVGVTVRPQQLVFDDYGVPAQKNVFNFQRVLLEKIDYARTNWGATMFYMDSTLGFWRPDEVVQLRWVAGKRPDILLIPEHHYWLYRAFSAPYLSVRRDPSGIGATFASKLYPRSFQAVDFGDSGAETAAVLAAQTHGDIVLCRAWYWNRDCDLLEQFDRSKGASR